MFERKLALDELKDLVMKDQQRYIYIVAGNNAEFMELVKSKPSEERWRYRYVSGVDVIRGLSSIEGVFYGSWRSRKDIEGIRMQIKIIKSTKDHYAVEN